MSAAEKSPRPQLGSSKKKVDIFLDRRTAFVHDMFSTQRVGAASTAQDAHKAAAESAKARLKVNQAAAGENQDGRGQDARAGYAVARVGERETRSRASGPFASAGRDPCPPHGAVDSFFAAFRPQAIDNPRFREKKGNFVKRIEGLWKPPDARLKLSE
jgi:hypothetical protein